MKWGVQNVRFYRRYYYYYHWVTHRPTLVQLHAHKFELIGSPDCSSVGTYRLSRIEQ
jgi:hypothetical protein